MIHILSSASASGCLKAALKEMGLDKKERIISFWDTFSVGPVWKLHEEAGVKFRFGWMEKCMSEEFGEYADYTHCFEKAMNRINSIPEGVHVTIWASNNAHEQTGLRFIMHLLKEKNIDITIINTTKAYEELFRVKKAKYTLLHTGEIPPEKLQVIYEQDYGKLLTDHDREDLENEWLALSESQETLRIWRNGRIQSVSEDYYDGIIIKKVKKLHGKQVTREFIKSARVIGEVLGHLDQYIGDTFLEYRIRKLIEAGVFESKGSLEQMRFYSVRLKG
ncbi:MULTISPECIES: DUF1835 domain-containing protein [Bacillaceae]|uniref:DUF1835 domain-containing protein n=1 Tax=Oceanobacillus caeni TaxID=405946 RepID=A0ABR5MF83_9BACI|nr:MULTISPECIES: DUF1835 domain-containing protein [Bacillaceae]KPH69323.1 hypothetical protein AFL42_17195 [Oceanobacillus caeni]MED4473889.1 DUF1835 domain-containing protein [Oceanobacillus caeni]